MEFLYTIPDWLKLSVVIIFGAGVFYGTNRLSMREIKAWMKLFEERLQTVEKSCVVSQERETTQGKQLERIANSIDILHQAVGELRGTVIESNKTK